jgi:hypothetical protein
MVPIFILFLLVWFSLELFLFSRIFSVRRRTKFRRFEALGFLGGLFLTRWNQQSLEKREDGWYASAQKTRSRKGKLGKLL